MNTRAPYKQTSFSLCLSNALVSSLTLCLVGTIIEISASTFRLALEPEILNDNEAGSHPQRPRFSFATVGIYLDGDKLPRADMPA